MELGVPRVHHAYAGENSGMRSVPLRAVCGQSAAVKLRDQGPGALPTAELPEHTLDLDSILGGPAGRARGMAARAAQPGLW